MITAFCIAVSLGFSCQDFTTGEEWLEPSAPDFEETELLCPGQ